MSASPSEEKQILRSDPVSLYPGDSWNIQFAGHAATHFMGPLFLTDTGEVGHRVGRTLVGQMLMLSPKKLTFLLPLADVTFMRKGPGLIKPTSIVISADGTLYTAAFMGLH